MKNPDEISETIKLLEKRLLQPEIRHSTEDVSEMLSDDFIEFGSSGHIYSKKQSIEGLQNEDSVRISISDFKATILSPDVVLVTYKAVKHEPNRQESRSIRSSIWRFIDDRWQIVFHQGTPADK